jgi:hypothetical protein
VTSKTKQSGRVDILVRMPPELKARVTKAATEDGATINDWLLDAIEEALAVRDAEVAADKKRTDLERRLEMKFNEIVVLLARGDITSLSARAQINLQEKAEGALAKWRHHTATFFMPNRDRRSSASPKITKTSRRRSNARGGSTPSATRDLVTIQTILMMSTNPNPMTSPMTTSVTNRGRQWKIDSLSIG